MFTTLQSCTDINKFRFADQVINICITTEQVLDPLTCVHIVSSQPSTILTLPINTDKTPPQQPAFVLLKSFVILKRQGKVAQSAMESCGPSDRQPLQAYKLGGVTWLSGVWSYLGHDGDTGQPTHTHTHTLALSRSLQYPPLLTCASLLLQSNTRHTLTSNIRTN